MAKKRGHILENLSLVSYLGVSMIVPIIGGVYLGRWIDSLLNSQPIFLFAFIIMGVIVAFTNLFKIATKDIDKKKRK
ncbi:AtpZ/AtpI family protein [Alkaliphilus pronyensis]|uniref:AtpZ/AtpI family protein n=1 Tax=Alkaliphilus pronyensis TaxID=1482732 RepID=A0A6I0FM02_9FIRM|nr:AtpZ/AtpI family protein [Alkaliphilus pronyensis]KAB3539709.1 AtpZ/AtpI family protein [Alkaliphilus pronyensis]